GIARLRVPWPGVALRLHLPSDLIASSVLRARPGRRRGAGARTVLGRPDRPGQRRRWYGRRSLHNASVQALDWHLRVVFSILRGEKAMRYPVAAPRGRKAFTLVELAVVIVIIG